MGRVHFLANGSTIYDYQATIHRLERRNRELEEEVELLKNSRSCAVPKEREISIFGDTFRYSIRKAYKTLGISRSGFYAYRERKSSDIPTHEGYL